MMTSRPAPDRDSERPASAWQVPLAAILIRHGTARYPHAPARLDRLIRECERPDRPIPRLIVDNALPAGASPMERADGWLVVPGDNRAWEFTGFDRGMDEADRRWAPRSYLLATSAFDALEIVYDGLLTRALVEAEVWGNAVLGIGDYRNEVFQFDGRRFSTWIRTSLMLMPAAVRARLGSTVTVHDVRRLLPDSWSEDWRARTSPRFGKSYLDLMVNWLTRDWHSSILLGEDTYPFFRDKVRSILNEHLLSERLRELQVDLMDLRYAQKVGPSGWLPPRPALWDQLEAIRTLLERLRGASPDPLLRLFRKLRRR